MGYKARAGGPGVVVEGAAGSGEGGRDRSGAGGEEIREKSRTWDDLAGC